MKNKLIDLNNHLFAAMERLSDEDLSSDDLHREIKRTSAVSKIAAQIISNGKLVLDAQKALSDNVIVSTFPMLEEDEDVGG